MSFLVKPSTIWAGGREGRFGADTAIEVSDEPSVAAGENGDLSLFSVGVLAAVEVVDTASPEDGNALAGACVVITAPGFPDGSIGWPSVGAVEGGVVTLDPSGVVVEAAPPGWSALVPGCAPAPFIAESPSRTLPCAPWLAAGLAGAGDGVPCSSRSACGNLRDVPVSLFTKAG